MDSREQTLHDWAVASLLRDGQGDAAGRPAWTPVSGDASFRRFFRLRDDSGASWIAMDAPPATENNAQFIALSRLFRAHGVNVPVVLASDLEHGFLLVTDLGDTLYAGIYGTAAQDSALESALQTLIRLQRVADDADLVPPYTAARLRDELDLFVTWLVEDLLGLALSTAERQLLADTWTLLIDNATGQRQVCVHRDFHSRNLLLDASGRAAVVDFQDALHGPLSYDLASLLRDCYHRFSEAEIERWRDRYLTLAREAGFETGRAADFALQFDRTAVQRQLKAIGIFARLHLRDAKDAYLPVIPAVLDHLIDVTGNDPALADFSAWLAQRIRQAARKHLVSE